MEQKKNNLTDKIASIKYDEGNYELLSRSEILYLLMKYFYFHEDLTLDIS